MLLILLVGFVAILAVGWEPIALVVLARPATLTEAQDVVEGTSGRRHLKIQGRVLRWRDELKPVGSWTIYFGESDVVAEVVEFSWGSQMLRATEWSPTGAVLAQFDQTSDPIAQRTEAPWWGDAQPQDRSTLDARRSSLSFGILEGQDLRGVDFSGSVLLAVRWSGADLTGASFASCLNGGPDFERAILTEADFSHSKLIGADLSHAVAHRARFAGTALPRARLTGASLVESDWTDAVLFLADLSNADLTGATGLEIEQLLQAGNWSLDDESRRTVFPPAIEAELRRRGLTDHFVPDGDWEERGWVRRFEDVDFSDFGFTYQDWTYTHFVRTDLSGARFEGVDLRDSAFIDTDLSTTSFVDADLDYADLSQARGLTVDQFVKARAWDLTSSYGTKVPEKLRAELERRGLQKKGQ
ncbi:MAG: pentapeptide repeat-containing protein [Planctomycetes bacterium]|nr:pentapeptide repeat-containing protein [Planctomycetota bacterium]